MSLQVSGFGRCFALRRVENTTASDLTAGHLQGDQALKLCLAGLLPEKAAVTAPPEGWYKEMATPSAEVVLAEFRRQRRGSSGTPPLKDSAAADAVIGSFAVFAISSTKHR